MELNIFLGERQTGRISKCVIKWCLLRRDRWSSKSQQFVMVNLTEKITLEKRLEEEESLTWGYLRAECSGRRNSGLPLAKFWAGACLGVLWRTQRPVLQKSREGGRRQVREVTVAKWCRAYAATVRILNSKQGGKLPEGLGQKWQDPTLTSVWEETSRGKRGHGQTIDSAAV